MTKKDKRSERAFRLMQAITRAKKDSSVNNTYTKQTIYEDPFDSYYDATAGVRVLKPPYSPIRMYELYEESGTLKSCAEAMVHNIDGYGHVIVPKVGTERELPEKELKKKRVLEDLFNEPNGLMSFVDLRQQVGLDYWVTGNGYMEIVRNLGGEPTFIFPVDAKFIRICPLDGEQVKTSVTVTRNGSPVTIEISRMFRKYAMINTYTTGGKRKDTVRFFKEYGDPRPMDALTGEYYPTELSQLASELIHFKHGTQTYGIPPWIGTLLEILGSINANYVNYDLFESQGIPPFILSIVGGELTDESFEDLLNLLEGAKGTKNFHRFLLLEVDSTMATLDGKEQLPKLNIQDMMQYRKEDALFSNYLGDTREAIRKFGFRLPRIFLGGAENMNYSTSKIVRELAEEQLFIPKRTLFDEMINNTIVKDLDAGPFRFRSLGPVIKSADDVIKMFPQLLKSGVFTMNELVDFTNENFGQRLRHYEEDWAELPISLLLHVFQSVGTAFGSGVRDGGGIPNAMGSMQAMLDTVKDTVDEYGVEPPSDEQ